MLTRRRFVQTAGLGAAGALTASWIAARGREDSIRSIVDPAISAAATGPLIILSSNENPVGPGTAVLEAVRAAFGRNGAAPGRYSSAASTLVETLARKHAVRPDNILLGCGSTQILRTATHVFTGRTKALVASIPTYEECTGYADMMGHPVRAIPLDAQFRMDLTRLADAARGAGLLFYCNPGNPTATYTGARTSRDFFARVARIAPETTILVDEAYFDYVTDPDHDTHIALAVADPRIVVARTFSKAFGMAGLRIGYAVAHADTIRKMADWDPPSGASSLNVLALHGGIAAASQDATFAANERMRNKAVREFAMKWFADRGMMPAESQANFMFVNIGRPAKAFRAACLAKGVKVARDFPPFQKTHCRISFGTMDEMQRAVAVFDQVLGKKTVAV